MSKFTNKEIGILALLGFEFLKAAQDLDHLLYINNLDSFTKEEIKRQIDMNELASILTKVKYTNGE